MLRSSAPVVFGASAATAVLALAAFVLSVELTVRAADVRPAAVLGALVAVALLRLPGRWRWLVLAWCLGLAAFGGCWWLLSTGPALRE